MSEKTPKAAARDMEFGPTKGRRLEYWQEVMRKDEAAWEPARAALREQEELLRGRRGITAPDGSAARKQASHSRNLVQELVEAQVDSNIPQPKVTALHKEDEDLARLIEDMLRNELDRLPMEVINDLQERVTPTHGGDLLWVDWDQTRNTHTTLGEVTVTAVHPMQFLPQAGVYDINDMEHWALKISRTWQYIKRRYGVDVRREREEDQDARTRVDEGVPEGIVTQWIVYYRNDHGGIGRYSYVEDTELEDLEDCQARRLRLCEDCGAAGNGVECVHCGGRRFREEVQEYEELYEDLTLYDGSVLSALEPETDEFGSVVYQDGRSSSLLWDAGAGELLTPFPTPTQTSGAFADYRRSGVSEPTAEGGSWAEMGEAEQGSGASSALPGGASRADFATTRPRRIPCYTPDLYPLVLRKNVSMAGQVLGGSDADALEGQQNEMSKIGTKLSKKVLGGGSILTKLASTKVQYTDGDYQVIDLENLQQKEAIGIYNTQVDISADLRYRSEIYEESRNIIGVTDSYQGRKDPTATSGKAKQFAAAQTAGRLESKRVMKNAAYQELFERLFKWKLAYADEPRPIVAYNDQGQKEYKSFNRWDFLRVDADGKPYWDDEFLFSCDTSAPLASNREQMWTEMRAQRQEGAFGDPNSLDSLILYWGMMEQLHYPMAGSIKADLQEQKQRQEAMQAQMMQAQAALPGMNGMAGGMPAEQTLPQGGFIPPEEVK